MSHHLLFCIDSDRYINTINFVRTFLWLAEQNQEDRFIVTGLAALRDILSFLPSEISGRFSLIDPVPLTPISDALEIKPLLETWEKPLLTDQNSSSLFSFLYLDRCVSYHHQFSLETLTTTLRPLDQFASFALIGSSTHQAIRINTFLDEIRRMKLTLNGFVLGNATGRHAPFWLSSCGEVFTEDVFAFHELREGPPSTTKVSLYHPPKLDVGESLQNGPSSLIIDIGIHSPRASLISLLKKLLTSRHDKDLTLFTCASSSFQNFIQRYLAAHKLPALNVTSDVSALLSSRLVLSLFPFAAKYFLQGFSRCEQPYIIDLDHRYATVDGLFRGYSRAIHRLEQTEGL